MPRALLSHPYLPARRSQVSPITGELVAIADMAEHMRISLIDPRWKEQKEAMLSKLRCAPLWCSPCGSPPPQPQRSPGR